MERTYWIEYLLWDPYKIFCMLPWLQIPSQTQRYFHEKELGSSSHTWLYICTCTCRDVCVYVSTTTTTFLPISILILIFILIPTPRSIPSSFLMPIPALYLSPPHSHNRNSILSPTHAHPCLHLPPLVQLLPHVYMHTCRSTSVHSEWWREGEQVTNTARPFCPEPKAAEAKALFRYHIRRVRIP